MTTTEQRARAKALLEKHRTSGAEMLGKRFITEADALAAISEALSEGVKLQADVVELVIAARIVAFEDKSPEAIKRLDNASEAFASRVPWESENG